MSRQEQTFVHFGALMLCCLAAVGPVLGNGSQATDGSQKASSPQTSRSAEANAINSGQDAADKLLNSLLQDKPTEAPKPPAGSINVSPPPQVNIASVDQTRLNQVGSAIARQLQRENDAGTRQLLIDAGKRIVAENSRREQTPGAQMPPTRPLNFDGEAYRQLVQHVAPVSREAGGAAGGIEPQREIARAAFEGSVASQATTVAPSGSHFFSGQMQTMKDATPYNPVPVIASKKISDLNISAPPPPSPAPGGSASAAQVPVKGVRIQYDETALELACQRGDLLEKFQDRLLAAGGPGDVGDTLAWVGEQMALALGASSKLEKVTSVSLKAICDAAGAFKQNWSGLPDGLRHPGGIHRIYGFIVDSQRDDLIVLGSAEGPGEAIDLDDLIVGFRAVLKDGVAPLCSLEPPPGDFGGPQRSIVGGVARNSHFARVMLDADYKLKTMLFSAEPLHGFRSIKDIVTDQLASGHISNWTARFWFTPLQPGEGEIRLSADDRAGLFNAGVQVLTEDLSNKEGVLVGTGSQSGVMREVTGQFTRQFDRLEQEAPIVAQLHGLFDIVMLANVLKTIHAPPGIIKRLLELPTINEEVPESYNGLTLAVEAGGIAFFHMKGGVTMDTTLNSRAVMRSEDPAINDLSRRLPGNGTALPVPISTGNPSDHRENEYLEAIHFLANFDYAKALSTVNGLLERDPTNAAYYKLRSRIYAHMGFYQLAEQEWLAVVRLVPQDPSLGVLRLQIALESGDPLDHHLLDGEGGEALASLYLSEAGQQRSSGGLLAALASMDRAVSLRPNRADLLSTRAVLYTNTKHWAEALEDISKAIRLNLASESSYLLRANLYRQMRNSTSALADANQALALNPKSLEAYFVRASVKMDLSPPDSEGAYADVRHALSIDPNNPWALDLQAELLASEGDRDGAFAAVSRAVKHYPGMAAPYALRAALYADEIFGSKDIPFTRHSDDALAMLNDLNKAVALNALDTSARRMLVDLTLAYADNLGNPEIKNWDAVLPILGKNTFLSSPAAFQKLQELKASSDSGNAQHALDAFRSAAVLFAIDQLEQIRDLVPQDLQPELRKKIQSLRQRVKQ